MIVTAWNNGMHARSGAGYGFKVSVEDRDAYFQQDWEVILLELDGEAQPMEVNINKTSFWNETCHELIHNKVGQWLRTLVKRQSAPVYTGTHWWKSIQSIENAKATCQEVAGRPSNTDVETGNVTVGRIL